MTQKDAVLKYIEEVGSISSFDAFREFGITRLSAVIYDLRKLGYDVVTETKETTNRFGKKIYYGVYYINEKVDSTE